MGQTSGHRRRAQMASAALVLMVVAAGTGIGQDGSAAASVPTTRSASAETDEKTQIARVTFDAEAIPTLRVTPAPDAPTRNKPGEEPTEPKPQGKVIYLTFDDGPSAHTKPVLHLLEKYGAKATFFLVGQNAVAHPELARSVVEQGHAVGSHTWNHRDLRRLSARRLNGQIIRTSNALRRVTGQPITCLRPPYGAVNREVRRAVRAHELATKLWDIDTRDWKRPGSTAISRKVVSRARNGAVVLMHDGGGNRSQTVRALDRILRRLSDRGYRFETLPGC